MGSVLDMENRYIITTGLSHIKNDFLHCLLDKQSYSITGKQGASWADIVNKTNPISIAFYIVPLVNALIRVGTMEEKELLFQAFIKGSQMVPCNKRGAKGTLERADVEAARVCTNAKAHQNKMLDEIMLQVEAKIFKYDLLENKILLLELDTEQFPSEINGLLAMKLSAKYKKPTLVLRAGDDYLLKGSMRGLNQSALSDFKSFLMNSGYFEWCQGHANAAGACIKSSAVEQFHTYANKALKDIDFGENIYNVNFERDVYANDLSNLVTDIARASYLWGQGNNEPLIHITNLHINSSDIRVMGANQDTLKIEFNGMPYIKFHAKDLIEEIKQHDGMMTLSLICRANLNEWMGKVTPQCIIDECEIKPYKSVVEF